MFYFFYKKSHNILFTEFNIYVKLLKMIKRKEEKMNKRSLLTMRDLSTDEIMNILNEARCFDNSFKDWQIPTNETLLIANLFFEPSTRTHFSFRSAELSLGFSVSDFNPDVSSVVKGETLYDTVKTFEAIGYDALVIRHSKDEYFVRILKGVWVKLMLTPLIEFIEYNTKISKHRQLWKNV